MPTSVHRCFWPTSLPMRVLFLVGEIVGGTAKFVGVMTRRRLLQPLGRALGLLAWSFWPLDSSRADAAPVTP